MQRLVPELRRLVGPLIFTLAVLVLIPLKFDKGLWLTVFTQAVIYSLASVGVGVLYGRLGLVSLANFAIYGVGGWVALRLGHLSSPPPVIISILVGGAVAAVLGTLVGLPALRLRGLYLALVTLMFSGAFYVVINAIGYPDGGSGFNGRNGTYSRYPMARPTFADSDEAFFRFAVILVALGFLLVWVHLRTKPGRSWAMIRRSQAAAFSAGVNTTLYKTWAFTLAGFLSGCAGGLAACYGGQLNTLDFRASASMLLFGLTVSAGSFHLLGSVLAGVLSKVLPSLFDQWGISADLATMVFGFLLMISLTSAPEGAAGQIYGLGKMIRGKFRGSKPTPAAASEAATGLTGAPPEPASASSEVSA